MEQPTPEHKDWMWVLDRPCLDCQFETLAAERGLLGPLIRANAAAWRALLRPGGLVSVRPPVAPGQSVVWSGLEYGCHVRDVYGIMAERLNLLLLKDEPTFQNWDQDQVAVTEGYDQQDPAKCGYDLAVAAGRVADIVDRIGDKQWPRKGYRSDGATFTVESLIRYLLHDTTHHVADVERGYKALVAAGEGDETGDVDGADESS